ncbi:MAG: M23 family metallopeptidase [Pseudomonadota bacterium]
MDIILVSSNLAKSRTVTLNGRHVLLLGAALLCLVVTMAWLLNTLMLRHAADSPYVQSLLLNAQKQEQQQQASYLQENLNAMAVKLGQLQAQLLRLDTLGERLAKLAGFNPQEFLFDRQPGQGGAVSTVPQQDMSFAEFNRQLARLSRELEERSDKLGIIDSLFTIDQARKKLVPSMQPILSGIYSSNFGWRIDPFTGKNAFHEGVDFIAETGTPVIAAAGGVVVYSDNHPQYGNMVEIDHGNDLITRYAHASKRLVAVGDVVRRGDKIAEVGNTGRSTGTHLHFEVRYKGAPQNPARFLKTPS